MSEAEAGVIRWGGQRLYVDEDNEVGLIVNGHDRFAWLEVLARHLAEYANDVLHGRGEEESTVEVRVSLLEVLWADGKGEFETPEDVAAWLDAAVADGLTLEEAQEIVLGDNDLFVGATRREFDDPAGQLDEYADSLSPARVAGQLALF